MANNKRKVNIMARAKKAAHEEPMEQVLWTAANKLRKTWTQQSINMLC